MTDTYLPDVSEFQPHADIAAIRLQTGAIAARVSYGTRLDKMMPARVMDIRAQGFVVVLYYLFLRATQPIQDQVNAVIGCLSDLHPGESIVIDYESDNGSIPSVAQRDQAAELFEQRYNRPTVVYENASTAQSAPTSRPVWVAAYGVKTEPAIPHLFWQYTDGQFTSAGHAPINWSGCGFCDSSVFHGSASELAAALQSVAPQQSTQPPNQGDDDLSDALTITYPDGTKTVATPDGGIKNAGTPFFGSRYSCRADELLDFTAFYALTAVDINNKDAGYIGWNVGKQGAVEQFKFDAEFLASHPS